MSCCDGCIKYLLFFFNLLFSLCGLALIILGSVLFSNTSSFSDVVDNVGTSLKTPQIFIIVVGVVIFFIASLGCCGAVRENRCMLITFAVLLLSLFIIQVAVGIYALTHKPNFKQQVEEGLNKQFAKLSTSPKERKLFEGMERNMECCGVYGFNDYIQSLSVVPTSCCEDEADCKVKPLTYWKVGCLQALTDFSGTAGETLGGVAIGLSVVEVLGAIFALRLASKVK